MARLIAAPPPTYPAAGTVLSTYCTGYDKYEQRANGTGGSTNVLVATNSTYCGYVPSGTPAAGTVLSTYCTGYDKYEQRADGSGGSTNVLIQANSSYCGYITTQTFTASTTFTTPAGVTNLLTVSGKGADGTPASAGSYAPNIHHSVLLSNVQGEESSAYPYHRLWNWSSSQGDLPAVRNAISVGGSGSYTSTDIFAVWELNTDKGDCSQYNTSPRTITWTNAVTNSATTSVDGGWQTTGSVGPTSSGNAYVDWDEQGAYSPGSSATTGANTTGFGKTFSGGVGVAASAGSFSNVTVTASTSYSLIVPSGGYITITY